MKKSIKPRNFKKEIEDYVKNEKQKQENTLLETRFEHRLRATRDSIIKMLIAYKITGYKLLNARKQLKSEKRAYGYYCTSNAYLITIIKALKIGSIIDLGCGINILLNELKYFLYYLKIKGFENEKSLINISKKIYNTNSENIIEKKDIISLTKSDVTGYDVLYFWEPLIDRISCEKFVNNLLKKMTVGQIIIYQCSGNIRDFLDEEGVKNGILSEPFYWNGFFMYQKIKEI
jgi:hypothetical protein